MLAACAAAAGETWHGKAGAKPVEKSLHKVCTSPGQTYWFAQHLHTKQACTEFAQIILPIFAQRITIFIDTIGFCLLIYGQ